MNDAYGFFTEVIDRLASDVPVEAKIALTGAIDYAVGRGDISIKQAEELDRRLGDVRMEYADVFEIATFGDLDQSDAVPV